jgi:hypothetical protein
MHIKQSIELGPGATKLIQTWTGETVQSGTKDITIPESTDALLGVVADVIAQLAPHALAAWADLKKLHTETTLKDGVVTETVALREEEAAAA